MFFSTKIKHMFVEGKPLNILPLTKTAFARFYFTAIEDENTMGFSCLNFFLDFKNIFI